MDLESCVIVPIRAVRELKSCVITAFLTNSYLAPVPVWQQLVAESDATLQQLSAAAIAKHQLRRR